MGYTAHSSVSEDGSSMGNGSAENATQQTAQVPRDIYTSRRRAAWAAVMAFLGAAVVMTVRFFFPRALFEPDSRFRIGAPADFSPGVDERFKQSHRIWVVRTPGRLFAIYARCTHLGCTPNWVETENKFKCPCHGSGYDMEGRNFEGPAPRPMDRARVELDAEGQIVVDTSRLSQCPAGGRCEFDSARDSFIAL
jgi:cytochrome b6-f complex iron-sulfur subunit